MTTKRLFYSNNLVLPSAAALFRPSQLPSLAAWYRWRVGVTIATGVSRWADQSGNGRDLVQADTTKQPAQQGDGSITFDGINDVMNVAFTLPQPVTAYLLGSLVTWSAGASAFAGNTANAMRLQEVTISPRVRAFSGSGSTELTTWALGTAAVIAAVFNGASSSLQKNLDAAITGNFGATGPDGVTLADNGPVGGAPANVNVREFLVYSAAHDAATIAKVVNYLNSLV